MARTTAVDLREAPFGASHFWGRFGFVIREAESFEMAFRRALMARYHCRDGSILLVIDDRSGAFTVRRRSGHISASGLWRHREEC